ncbi:hypothetical protein Hanom_Chr06g00524871 [Helianthus anomalus]
MMTMMMLMTMMKMTLMMMRLLTMKMHNRILQKPVLARFIPLELKGDTLPLGCGLCSLKLLFSIANSLNCCLL